MNGKKRTVKRTKRSRLSRCMAMLLAMTLLLTSSGFQSLADEMDTEAAEETYTLELAPEEDPSTEEEWEEPAEDYEEEVPEEEALGDEAAEEDAEEYADEAEADEAEEEEAEEEEETEPWDGYFSSEHPEKGGILEAEISGEKITLNIPENAFTEAVSLQGEAKTESYESVKNETAQDSALLQKVFDKAYEYKEEESKEKDTVYDFYVLDLYFVNDSYEKVEPAETISVTVDSNADPVSLGAAGADYWEIEKALYRINPYSDEAETIYSDLYLNDDNQLCELAFSSDSFSSAFVLLMTKAYEEEETETEEWDGYFDIAHPEKGGIAVAEISGEQGGTVTAEIPEGAFDEMVTLWASSAVYTADEADAAMLDAVLAAADVDEDAVYGLYTLEIGFVNGDGEQVEPAAPVTITVDTSASPVDVNAADAAEAEASIYHYDETSGEAAKMGTVVSMDEENDVTGMAFAADSFSPFVVLVNEGEESTEDEEETELVAEAESETEAEEEKVYTAGDGGVMVTVTAPASALPEDAILQVITYDEGSDEYAKAAETIGVEPGAVETVAVESEEEEEEEDSSFIDTLYSFLKKDKDEEEAEESEQTWMSVQTGLAVVDIHFLSDGEEVEPTAPVSVTIDASAVIPEDVLEDTIEVQHLVENEDGEVTPVVVGGEAEVVEFEVESFSTFTVTWSNDVVPGTGATETSYTITFHPCDDEGSYIVDDMGTKFDGMDLTRTIGETFDVTTMTFDGYTFEAAYVIYDGTRYDNVTSVGIVTSGGNYVLQIEYEDGTYTSEALGGEGEENNLNVDVYVVYTPDCSVTITATGDESSGYTLTAETEHFSGTPDIEWTYSGSDTATVEVNSDGTVSVNWSDSVQAGDTVTIKATATYTTADGTKQKATASYTLTYGTVPLTIQVWYTESSVGGGPQTGTTTVYPEGADVSLVDENGNIVASGTTGENGYITFDVLPGTYTVMAEYETTSTGGGGPTGAPDNYQGTSYMSDPTEINVTENMGTVSIEMTATSNTVDHIDIGISATATLYINGVELKADVSISEFDFESDSFEFYFSMDGGYTYYDASGFMDMSTFEESSGQDGITQVRVDGSYPVGTIDNPYIYYMRITKDVTFTDEDGQEYTVSMTFFAEFSFWDEDNNCPGVGGDNYDTWREGGIPNEAGMDFILGASANDAVLYIEKVVRDSNGNLMDATGETFTFDIYNPDYEGGTEPYDTVEMTLTSSGIGYIIAVVEPGTYYVVESGYEDSINSQDYVGTYIETIADASQAEPGYEGTPKDNDAARTSDSQTASASTEEESGLSPIYIFTNVYEATVDILVAKDWEDDDDKNRPESITIQLTADGEKVEGETLILPTADGNWYGTFTNLPETDSDGKEIEYSVVETGVSSPYNSSVGELTYNEENNIYTIEVTNTYHPGSLQFGVTKTITGRDSTAKSFTFALYKADEGFNYSADTLLKNQSTTGTLTEDVTQSVVFDMDIEYTEGGTYYYVVKEVTSSGNGWTCDDTEYHVTVTTVNKDGSIVIDNVTYTYVDSEGTTYSGGLSDDENGVYGISGDSTLSFVNTYEDAESDVIFGGTKSITGTNSTTASFAFGLYETGSDFVVSDDSEVHATTVTGSGDFAFEEIDYTTAGTYYYVVKETTEDGSGWTVDGTEYHITVVVADETSDEGTGTFTITVSCTDAEGNTVELTQTQDEGTGIYTITGLDFENAYDASGSLNLTATKEYTGATLTANQFNFTITETTEGVEEENLYTGTGTNDADGNITFTPDIGYTLDDVGTHIYEIVETVGDAGGVTYASDTITVTVVVEDNGNGTLSTTVTVDGEGVTAETDGSYNVGAFENSYEATGSVTFGGEKTISGKDEETSQQFTFELYTTDSDFTVAENAEATDTKTVTGAGSFTFETISYDSDVEGNGEGTYYYVVKETSTDENGWTMDTNEYHITVVVTDAGDGTFTLAVTAVDAEGEAGTLTQAEDGSYSFTGLDFDNEYEPAPTSVQFIGTKYITNSASDESIEKEFTFELYNTDSSFTTSGEAIQTKTTTGAGSITFDKIEYKETETYYYVIQEKALDEAEGWTIDPTVYNITVEVTDNGVGQLMATVTEVTKGTVTGTEDVYGGFDFTNAYAAEGKVTLGIVKSISGVASTDEEFEFTLYNSDESFATGDSIETITTDGTITNSTELNFAAIPYTEAGTYYYVITETGTAPDGWTPDTKEYHVTVTVTDNGDGTLTTGASYAYVDEEGEDQTGNAAAFTNTYDATGELALTGTKTFEGGTLTADSFTFTMNDSTGESVGDVTMDANGAITFPTLTYDETDIGGEYTYMITETAGTDSNVEYDDTTYTVVVSVADNGDGTLDVTYTVNGTESGDITFTNYQKGSLTITKTFTGLTEDQLESLTGFTITVTNSDGDTVATLTLDDADEGSSYTWTVSDLSADTYTVTETGYSLDGYEVVAKSGELEVTDGSDVSVDDVLAWGGEDTVEFTNDYTEVGTITISKYVIAEEDVQKDHKETKYTVVITASEDADFRWVEVKNSEGEEIEFTPEGNMITFTITEDETVTITGLPAGSYSVEETGSDAATSESFVPIYRVNDEEDEGVPTVTVKSGSENVVTVEIDNEYPIGTYILVQKDYNNDEFPNGGFSFTIEALSCDLEAEDVTLTAEEMPMPDSTTVTITESGETGYFGNIEYEHLGTYYYKITETAGSDDSIIYDESVHYIKVVVASTEGTYVETTDEYEAKADAETDDYKNLDYTEAGIVTAKFTNTALEELTLEKEVAGDGDTSEYEFEIALSDTDYSENGFKAGEIVVKVAAGEKVTLKVPHGVSATITELTTGADSTTVYLNGSEEASVHVTGTTTEATADIGTIADSTQVKFVNSYRSYFPIDEEIVTDTDDIFDRDAWVKNEAVNEYNAIEIEMTTNLPVITAYDLENGSFTMNFHEVLEHELVLDEDTADFSVYIGGELISTAYYRITFDDDTGDDCNFHVDVDLTALYNDGIVTEDMLDGNTEITIFFFADLEGTGLNGSYTSTIWYDIYDGDEWLYTSNESVVAVYTYEVEVQKYDASALSGTDYAGAALAGATLGIYYDQAGTDPVSRNGEPYQVTSEDDGMAIFYGLADGTYYVKELEAPSGYVLSNTVLTVTLGSGLSGNAWEGVFANNPEEEKETPATEKKQSPKKSVDVGSGTEVEAGEELIYTITYYNYYDEPVEVTITDELDDGVKFVDASDGGSYDKSTHTVTWVIADAPAQEEGFVTLTVEVTEKAAGQVANEATVEIDGDEPEDTNLVRNPIPEEGSGSGTNGGEDGGSGTGVKTGDDTPLGLYLSLMLIAMALLGSTLVYRRRRSR